MLRLLITLLCTCGLALMHAQSNTPSEKARPWNSDWRARNNERFRLLKVDSTRYAMMPAEFDAELVDGNQNRRSLTSLIEANTEKVTLVYFWSRTCPPCMKTLPKLLSMERDYQDKALEVVYVNVYDTELKWDDYNKSSRMIERQHSYRLTNLNEAPLSGAIALSSVPRFLLFGRQGRLCEIKLPSPGNGLEAYLNELLEF